MWLEGNPIKSLLPFPFLTFFAKVCYEVPFWFDCVARNLVNSQRLFAHSFEENETAFLTSTTEIEKKGKTFGIDYQQYILHSFY